MKIDIKDNKIKDLLLKYHSGEISSEEFKFLLNRINVLSSEELFAVLSAHWNEFEKMELLSFRKKDELYKALQRKINMSLIKRVRLHWMQIAASLLFLVISVWAVSLYTKNREIQQLVNQDVVIHSGDSGCSAVVLPDGTNVRLNAKSKLVYRQNFGLNDREVFLSGEGYFEVKNDKEKLFVVKTDYINVAVLGTVFNICAYENKDYVEMALVKGSVRVCTELPPYKTVLVKPNEKVTFDKQTGELNLRHTDNRVETSWINKELVFKQMSLRDVFACLERKFDVKIVVDDEQIFSDVYTGVFDDNNINSIMHVLQLHYGFSYTIENGIITIHLNKE